MLSPHSKGLKSADGGQSSLVFAALSQVESPVLTLSEGGALYCVALTTGDLLAHFQPKVILMATYRMAPAEVNIS